MADLLREFLSEAEEHLAALDNDLLVLEKNPDDAHVLARAFRAMHSIKGSCGFLKLPRLESLARTGERIMGHYRDNRLPISPQALASLLRMTETMRNITTHLARTGKEPLEKTTGDDETLTQAHRFGTPLAGRI